MSSASDSAWERAPLNLPAVILFSLTTLGMLTVFPWYAWTHDFSAAAWVWFVVFMYGTGMSITGGYHRLWAHRAYQAHWSLKIVYMLLGAMSLQNSILIWASMHRIHHKEVDHRDRDPYSAERGLWFSHMGWMLRNYPSSALDFKNARDLMEDPIVMFQHKHYLGIALFMNIAVPALLGWAYGDVGGFLMLVGLLRLVMSQHFTFFINSLAHYWGRQPYTTENSARDNDVLALFTYGEGYHNYHHIFQWDYRNGIRWWQWDPTKWMIAGAARLGLAYNLKRVPEFVIRRQMVQRQLERAQAQLAKAQPEVQPGRLAALQTLLEHELKHYAEIASEWAKLQQEKLEAAKRQLAEQWENSEARARIRALEDSLHQQHRRLRLLSLQAAQVAA
ncbi:fatty acid desaturase [Solimonas sp. SE-A11]|uniref:acyl-CoA desaturase n=1 Tax=Solimonas sp. SE-A11 TaxID=3054954 RepID=UPI00259D14FB|nr:fatty acid desaturase [Solimonas sp. SE-A11]MDM4770427.1 fatty acid desaturase [Solimonas sp. SE-A11]